MTIEIEQILNVSRQELEALKVASLGEGFRFIERLAEEWDSGQNRFLEPGESLWGAFLGEEMIGICGLNRDPYARNENAGRLRHLYVLPVRRREGAGRALVHVVLGKAREHFARLYLRTDNSAAAAFYERIGFVRVAGKEHVTHQLVFQQPEKNL